QRECPDRSEHVAQRSIAAPIVILAHRRAAIEEPELRIAQRAADTELRERGADSPQQDQFVPASANGESNNERLIAAPRCAAHGEVGQAAEFNGERGY